MAEVYDRWHKSRPKPGGDLCPEHDKAPSAGHGRGARWQVRYREGAGQQRKENFEKKTAAETRAKLVGAELIKGSYVDPKSGRIKLREYGESWLAARTSDPASIQTAESVLRLHVFAHLGDYELRALAGRPSVIQAWLSGLSSFSATHVRQIFGYLSAILSAAVDDGLIGRNPCSSSSVRMPAPQKRKVVPWTAERVAAVRTGLPEQYAATVDLGAGCGLRQGEVLGLAADDIDWLRRIVHVRRQVRIIRGKLVFALPKGAKERDVPLASTVSLRLAAHVKQHPAQRVTLPWREPSGKPVTADLLFTMRGSAIVRDRYNDLWKPALAGAGVIPAPASGKRYAAAREHGFHATRHYYASALLSDGVDIRTVAEYLGHTDAAFTLRTYVHLMPGGEEKARRAIDRAFGSEPSALSVPSGGV